MASLVEIRAGGERRFDLAAVTSIGRDPANDICLSDPMVSPRHAEVRGGPDGEFRLVDLGSRRGTYLSSRRVQDAALKEGDEILIGVARLRFEKNGARVARPGERLSLENLFKLPVEVSFRPTADIGSVDDLRRDHEKLRAAVELTRAIGVEHDPEALLKRLLDTAFHLLAAERGMAMLIDPTTGTPTLQISRGRDGRPADVVVSTSILCEVISSKAGVITSDAGTDQRFSRAASICAQGIRSAMCVPLVYREEILGLVHLDSRGASGAFTAKDLELFSTIVAQAALAVKNALLVGMMRDQETAERKRLERIVGHLPSGVMLLDGDRRIIAANELAAELLPAVTDSRVGDRLDVVGQISIDEILAYRGRAPLTTPARGKKIFSLTAAPVGAETVVVVRDVTVEKAEEAKNAQQDRLALIGQLAGGVAHDFNNLLAVILNYARFAEPEIHDSEVREDVRQIRLAATRAAELTKQLLAFSRREVIHPRVIEPNKLVADMEKLLRRTLGEDIELTTAFAAELPPVKADPTKLEQVLLNLVVNARDAMPDGGTLRVETSAVDVEGAAAEADGLTPGRYVVLSVADTGRGMSPEVAAHVFEPFFTTKERGKGTGLGLADGVRHRQAGGRRHLAPLGGRRRHHVPRDPPRQRRAARQRRNVGRTGGRARDHPRRRGRARGARAHAAHPPDGRLLGAHRRQRRRGARHRRVEPAGRSSSSSPTSSCPACRASTSPRSSWPCVRSAACCTCRAISTTWWRKKASSAPAWRSCRSPSRAKISSGASAPSSSPTRSSRKATA